MPQPLQPRSFILGVLWDVDARSCWQLAEQAGDASPQAMQRLLGEAVWDADAVRDDVHDYVIDDRGSGVQVDMRSASMGVPR